MTVERAVLRAGGIIRWAPRASFWSRSRRRKQRLYIPNPKSRCVSSRVERAGFDGATVGGQIPGRAAGANDENRGDIAKSKW